ncbi:MAG: ParB/RepB/Spo0J family partition protein [Syntrophobacteraceae bacterium]
MEDEMEEFEFHELANVFPLMQGEEFQALVNDIHENGPRNPIVLYEGKVLDGRNRLRACREAGVEPIIREWEEKDGDVVRFVISMNVQRRHLNESQRAMIATSLATFRKGQRKSNAQNCAFGVTQEDAGKLMNVSRRYVQDAAKLKKIAIPQVSEAVVNGEFSIQRGLDIAEGAPEKQKAFLSLSEKEREKKLRAISHAKKQDGREEPQSQAMREVSVKGNADLAEKFEVATGAMLSLIELARTGGWVELSKATVGYHLKRLEAAVEDMSEVAGEIDQSPETVPEISEIDKSEGTEDADANSTDSLAEHDAQSEGGDQGKLSNDSAEEEETGASVNTVGVNETEHPECSGNPLKNWEKCNKCARFSICSKKM